MSISRFFYVVGSTWTRPILDSLPMRQTATKRELYHGFRECFDCTTRFRERRTEATETACSDEDNAFSSKFNEEYQVIHAKAMRFCRGSDASGADCGEKSEPDSTNFRGKH